MEQVHDLLKQTGLPPVAVLIIVIVMGTIVFFVKRALNSRDERGKRRFATLHKYAGRQEEALLQAYRLLYEQVDLRRLTCTELRRVVSEADDLIMGPFTTYRAHLDNRLIAFLYGLHNVVAQYKPDPNFQVEVTHEAIDNLWRYKEQFLKDIESFKDMIRKSN